MVQAVHQRPEFVLELLAQRLHQPLRQVVAVALHQVFHLDLVALVQPVFLVVGQRTFEEITRAVKAQNRQAALFGAAARGCKVVEQQLLAQDGVNGFGQCGAFARAQTLVVAEKTRHNRIGGVFELEGEPDEFGTGVKQGFRMHSQGLSHDQRNTPAPD